MRSSARLLAMRVNAKSECDDAKYARGPVSLQAAGGIVRYRNVQIRELK